MPPGVIFSIGTCFLAYLGFKAVFFSWKMVRLYILPLFGFVKDLRQYGEWAVVTGSTDGIGQAYARELALRGMKIVLISRSAEKLNKTSQVIASESGAETKSICIDFAVSPDYTCIHKEIRDLDIGILVNNVGMFAGTEPKLFQDADVDVLKRELTVNTVPEIHLTHIVLKGMIQRKRGIVVHVSSGTTHASIPCLGTYGATKSFVSYLTRMLRVEASACEGVRHQLLIPHEVATNMTKKPQTLNRPSPQVFAKSAVRTIGLYDEVSGYWVHELERLLADVVPVWLVNTMLRSVVADVRKKMVVKLE